jgi:hypothetical protein
VEEAVLKPEIINEQVAKYQEREVTNTRQVHNESDQIERDVQKLANEESRVLEAYRMGILSPSQLSRELEKVSIRKNVLRNRRDHLVEQSNQPTLQNIEKSVADYCKQAAERLRSFTPDERQQFLRLIIDRVIFEGGQVRIKAILPLPQSGAERMSRADVAAGEKAVASGSGFTSTMMNPYGRNKVASNHRIADTVTHSYGRNKVRGNDYLASTAIYHDGLNAAPDYYSQQLLSEGENLVDYVNFELFKKLPKKPFSILSSEGLKMVSLLRLKNGDPTLQELCDQIEKESGVKVSISHMGRVLKRLGLSPARRGPRPKELKRTAYSGGHSDAT